MAEGSLSTLVQQAEVIDDVDELTCRACGAQYNDPRVLACFHVFCAQCIESQLSVSENTFCCPLCSTETHTANGVNELLSDYGLIKLISLQHMEPNSAVSAGACDNGVEECNSCTSGKQTPVAYCRTCEHHLCAPCASAHARMLCFKTHDVEMIAANPTTPLCLQHNERLEHYCTVCDCVVCKMCFVEGESHHGHECKDIDEVASSALEEMRTVLTQARNKQALTSRLFVSANALIDSMEESRQRTVAKIEAQARHLVEAVDAERRRKLAIVHDRTNHGIVSLKKFNESLTTYACKLDQTSAFTERLLSNAAPEEALIFKNLLDTRLRVMLHYKPDDSYLANVTNVNYEPVVNDIDIGKYMAAAFGKVEPESPPTYCASEMSRVMAEINMSDSCSSNESSSTPCMTSSSRSEMSHLTDTLMNCSVSNSPCVNRINEAVHSHSSERARNDVFRALSETSTSSDAWPVVPSLNHSAKASELSPPPLVGYVRHGSTGMMPAAPNLKRQKMIYHMKFGDYGTDEGHFTEPSGVAVGSMGQIIVADTNNHRMQMFDCTGHFMQSFGESCRRDCQIYPNRVAVNRITGEIVITERSPTHQIQVFSPHGEFIRKFGGNVLQHPRGVCIDHCQRIIVVECKVMRIVIFTMDGHVLTKICCGNALEFPNGVCANEHNEIFVSDNRAHCVKVFSYEGELLRRIGGEGITNYPIGVCINRMGEVVIADNHNNFNITVFKQDGTLIGAYESKVKHAQCFDVALTDDDCIVLASKDYKIYQYRYTTPLTPTARMLFGAEGKHLSERSPPMPGDQSHISYLDGSVIMPHASPPF